MEQNKANRYIPAFTALQSVICKAIKRGFWIRLEKTALKAQEKLRSFVSRQHLNNLTSFLNTGHFLCDQSSSKIKADKNIQSPFLKHSSKQTKLPKTARLNQRETKITSSSHHISKTSRQYHQRASSNCSVTAFASNPIPLWVYQRKHEDSEEEDSEEEQFANKVRETKDRREKYKTRIIEAEQLKKQPLIKPQERSRVFQKTKTKSKKQKLNLPPHFVDMEIQISENHVFQSTKNQQKSTHFQKFILKSQNSSKSLQVSPKKVRHNIPRTSRQWQPLVTQQPQPMIQNPRNIKLSAGVFLRQSIVRSGPNNLGIINAAANRKKIHLLKTPDGNGMKMKFNDLLSYKKLGSMTHMAYCSSMKTVKQLSQNTETNISIDSRQLVQEHQNCSRKMIKIVNHKMFEELIKNDQEGEFGDQRNRKKMRLKKEAKVRFSNKAE